MIIIVVLIVLLAIIALIVILLHFSLTVSVNVSGDGMSVKAKYLWLDLYPKKPKKQKKKKSTSRKKAPAKKKTEPKKVEEKPSEKADFDDNIEEEISDYELMHGISKEQEEKLIASQAENIDDSEKENVQKSERKHVDKKAVKKQSPKKKVGKSESKNEKKSSGIRGKIEDLRAKYNKYKPYIPMTWRLFKKLLKKIRISIDSAEITVGREDAHEAAIYYGAVQGIIANLLSFLSEVFEVSVKKCDVDCDFIENKFGGRADISVRLRPSVLIAIAVCFAVNFLIIRHKEKNQTENNRGEKPVTA